MSTLLAPSCSPHAMPHHRLSPRHDAATDASSHAERTPQTLRRTSLSPILIVASLPSMSVLLRTQLESTDAFACEVVRDAAAALARLEACAFPLVIMDEVRRSDDHLLAFIDAIAQLPPDRRPRTLLCTNRDHPSEHIPYLRMGYDSCLGKPFTKQMLLNAVHHLIAPSC